MMMICHIFFITSYYTIVNSLFYANLNDDGLLLYIQVPYLYPSIILFKKIRDTSSLYGAWNAGILCGM